MGFDGIVEGQLTRRDGVRFCFGWNDIFCVALVLVLFIVRSSNFDPCILTHHRWRLYFHFAIGRFVEWWLWWWWWLLRRHGYGAVVGMDETMLRQATDMFHRLAVMRIIFVQIFDSDAIANEHRIQHASDETTHEGREFVIDLGQCRRRTDRHQ